MTVRLLGNDGRSEEEADRRGTQEDLWNLHSNEQRANWAQATQEAARRSGTLEVRALLLPSRLRRYIRGRSRTQTAREARALAKAWQGSAQEGQGQANQALNKAAGDEIETKAMHTTRLLCVCVSLAHYHVV